MDELLTLTGNTLRLERRQREPVLLVLLVGNTLASHYWLNILAMSADPRCRHYITEMDYGIVAERMHIQPRVSPAFLVFCQGYVVDWFPAPLPAPGCIQDPTSLMTMVLAKIPEYT